MSPVFHRRAGIASGVVVALAAASLTFFAVQSKGETVHEADLNDGGVWVSATNHAQFARMNKAAKQFDAGVQANVTPGSGLDVLQDGSAVLGASLATNQLLPIDPQTGRLDSSAAVTYPARTKRVANEYVPPTVDLRGGTVAMVDPTSGKVWAQRVGTSGPLQGLDLSTTADPVAKVGAVAAVTVDVTGGVHAVSAATGTVVTIPAAGDSFGKPVTSRIKLRASAVDITAVGTRWVVYDPVDDQLFAQGLDAPVAGGVRRTGSLAYAALQQAGPASDSVALETATEVRVIGLGGQPDQGGIRLPNATGAAESPMVSRPLRLGSCVHGAWARTAEAYYGVNCGQDDATSAGTLTRPGDVPLRDGMALRTNHGLVVLNDLDTGDAWDLDSKPLKVDNWDSVVPPSQTDDNSKNKDKNVVDDTSTPQPPKAEPDTYKVRAGRTSKLHVLDNDTDSAGSILAIAPDEVTTPNVPGVVTTVAGDGQSIDITVPARPQARSFSLSYKVNNGTSAPHAQATVSVTVVDDSVNSPPTLRDGQAKIATTAYPVVAGGRLPLQVLGDWRDPECDPVSVAPTDSGSLVDGLGRLVVRAGQKAGSEAVDYTVEDDHGARTKAKVTLNVLGKDSKFRAPGTQPDVVRGVVGKPLQIEPLGNDIAGADPQEPDARMRLATEVRSQGSLTVQTELDTGVVTITGSAKGTYQLTYAAQVGQGVAPGRIRVDLIENPDPDAPPVANGDSATVREQTPVMADVLANDYSPRADVLVTRSVSTDADSDWLRPSIYQGRWVRVEALEPYTGSAPRTGTVRYVVSDGRKFSTGELTVTQRPADDSALPIVQDDTAVVRYGDTVTVPVLDNDSMAEGVPLVLDPDSVKVLGGEAQDAFASGNVLRYVPDTTKPIAAEKVVTIEYGAYPIGDKSKEQSARVTVTVKPPPGPTSPNQAPTARSFSASVVAGEPLTITVPTSGVDPDGDSVTVQGIEGEDGGPVELSLGRVTGFGASTIKYEAYPRAAGTEVLHYRVADRYGAESTGFVRIGVVQPGDPQPPVAVEDEVRAAPGKTVTIDPTENDLIARGDVVDLTYKDLNPAGELAKWRIDAGASTFRTTVPPVADGPRRLTYGIDNGVFDPSRSTIAVVPVKGWKNRPVAVDDVAKPKADEQTTLVDALANDRDVDGDHSELRIVRTLSPEGVVEGNKVRVRVLDHPHTVPYVIEDADGETAMALIYVPTGSNGAPFVADGSLIEMGKDSTKTVAIGDYVKSPRARVVSLTTPDTLSASPAGNLAVENDGRNTLTLTSSNGYVGPGAVLLEVTDKENAQQTDARTAYVSIPVQIGPKVPLLTCPDFSVSLTAAGRPRSLDIPTLCHAWLPPGLTADQVKYQAGWDPESKGVDLEQAGTGGREVVLRAGRDAPSSVGGRVRVQPENGSPSYIRVTVLGLDTDPAKAAVDQQGNPLQTAPPPRVRPFAVDGLKAGSSQTVDLHGYLDSPLDKPSCTVGAARIVSGKQLTASASGCSVTVTAGPDSSGKGVVEVSVSDGPGRNAVGRGTISVLGRPLAPGGVSATADRVNGGTARVSWTPPTFDGGSPITSYTVYTTGPGAPGPQQCSASPCTVPGLTDGQQYTFSVSATNGVGEGPKAGPSAPVEPDTLPNPVTGVHMVSRGDGYLVVGWTEPPRKGSPVSSYQVQVVDTTTGSAKRTSVTAPGTQARIAGLVNDHVQRVSVRAVNRLGAGPYGPSADLQSAGTPQAVGAPTLTTPAPAQGATSSSVDVNWNPVAPNGPTLVGYTVYRRTGTGAWTKRGTTSPGTTFFRDDGVSYSGETYGYVVTATNGASNESAKANVSTIKPTGFPTTPTGLKARTDSPNYKAQFSVVLNESNANGYKAVEWSAGGKSGIVSCACPEGARTPDLTTNANLPVSASGYGLKVRGINTAGRAGPWSTAVTIRPYGPTPTPNNGRHSASGKTVNFSWSLPTNGRAITQVKINGTVYGSAKTSISFTGNYSQSWTVKVFAYSAAGWSDNALTMTQQAEAAPVKPSVTVLKGQTCSQRSCNTGNGSCTSSACRWIAVRTANYPGGTRVTCSFTADGQSVSGWYDLTLGPNNYKESNNFYGYSGHTVTASCTGGVRDSITW
ncbi:fibronectin type III domain-containing protein [Phycicoccus sp. M110.8]|uniref:Ig-like domain-containing protein n=1 Tax=Phycicoccus sp. M110.8 TaxID=3075433 RepID=UPI0028FDBCCA|nr:Ig-like domain-containing protein [Phycicoccus sp. M110.8]MDU0313668.1 fibronectin type III domain-containing protein [Phycicoccus sp. M110.8]